MLFADRYSVVFDKVEDADDLKYKKTDWKQLYEQSKSVQSTSSAAANLPMQNVQSVEENVESVAKEYSKNT